MHSVRFATLILQIATSSLITKSNWIIIKRFKENEMRRKNNDGIGRRMLPMLHRRCFSYRIAVEMNVKSLEPKGK